MSAHKVDSADGTIFELKLATSSSIPSKVLKNERNPWHPFLQNLCKW